MGVYPEIWGPHAWAFIHLSTIAEKSPLSKVRLNHYKTFFDILSEIIPCEKCRIHLKDNLLKMKDINTIKSKRELFDWTVELHNIVNRYNGKKQFDKNDAYKHWKNVSEGITTISGEKIICKRNNYKIMFYILLTIIACYILFNIYFA